MRVNKFDLELFVAPADYRGKIPQIPLPRSFTISLIFIRRI
jgi:hypothetical protein